MISGNYRSVSPSDVPCTSSTAGSHSETGETGREKSRWQPCTAKQWLGDPSGRLESSVDRGITNLPNEAVVKILSKLDIRTLSVCRHVSKVRNASFGPGGHHLVTVSDDDTAKIWLVKGRGKDRPPLWPDSCRIL